MVFRRLIILLLLVLLFGGDAHAEPYAQMPAGIYKLDPRHTSIIFKISHFGFSHFTGRFDRVEGQLTYDPIAPDKSSLDVTIYPASVDTNDNELDEDLVGENWFDALHYPHASFHADHVDLGNGANGYIIGDFNLHGVTRTLILDVDFVGAGTAPFIGDQVMGFSAHGHFDRSDYGVSNLVPFIGDEVALQIETEFDKE